MAELSIPVLVSMPGCGRAQVNHLVNRRLAGSHCERTGKQHKVMNTYTEIDSFLPYLLGGGILDDGGKDQSDWKVRYLCRYHHNY